jgi:NADH-quinone oxidoreductase subunit J
MTAEFVVFWILAVASVAGALAVVLPPFGRNPLHAAIALLITFTCLAGLMVLLSAHLVAVLQILVYAGAVMVLFTFVVMMLNLRRQDLAGFRITAWKVVGVIALVALSVKIGILLVAGLSGFDNVSASAPITNDFGGIRTVGRSLLTTYLVPFEATSLLLLVAIVGALIVARRRDGGAS